MSLQRLTLRAKQSLSGLYSFGDTQNPSSNENTKPPSDEIKADDPINLEEFGLCTSNVSSASPDVHKSSPSRDSPSRRKRLMGSLRRIGSLRNMQSPPSKTKDRSDILTEPESPRTPVRGMRQSLALNFEESPPGRPMFEILSRDRSDS
ncbi:hypothetical protein P153DRAFT_282817 [Dothidotthia symphoricarpi CBS 119687]|uniref:Uncharacterized protein n=1 Tax=Dothidotthia symphoricarpi CBS 119687 TaxID=1392245 RepID=A0A6A6AMF4_9PLEO|nr:uncharacterized protein P153DRAFT_282817 [Dothidotthia symphoricarpi CBS 119687]KAF2133162.1 hypothetical protein P153DRAFT_282817 [Dothidotthia symphoricarpi CBS 119687]